MQSKAKAMMTPTKRKKNNRTALQEAVWLLARRPLSQKELRLKLQQRLYSASDIDETLETLTHRGALDDVALCRRLFQLYSEEGGHGLRYILFKLKMRGLSTDCLADEIRLWQDTDEDDRQAMLLLEKRGVHPANEAESRKMLRLLATRGFSPATLYRIADRLGYEE